MAREDFEGNRTEYGREARGLVQSITEALGKPEQRVVSRVWDPARYLITRETEPIEGGVRITDYQYNAGGELVERKVTVGSDQRLWTYTWDNHLLMRIDGPRTDVSDITSFTYDSAGNRRSRVDAVGHTTRYTAYDDNGLLLSMVDANGLDALPVQPPARSAGAGACGAGGHRAV